MIRTPSTKDKTKKPIRKISVKQAAKNRARGKAYDHLDHQWEPGHCQGCGTWQPVIDHSHLLSQKDYPELAGEPANIVPHCRDCHIRWELPTQRWKLLDFQDNMEFIQRVAPREFEKMMGQSEMKIGRHYGQDELEKFLKIAQGF